eukprot:1158339-Pelagomonas_calceolata.AAC.1
MSSTEVDIRGGTPTHLPTGRATSIIDAALLMRVSLELLCPVLPLLLDVLRHGLPSCTQLLHGVLRGEGGPSRSAGLQSGHRVLHVQHVAGVLGGGLLFRRALRPPRQLVCFLLPGSKLVWGQLLVLAGQLRGSITQLQALLLEPGPLRLRTQGG